MYGVLRLMPAGFTESEFMEAIADYMEEMIGMVGATEGVYVSIDGVVCAAKRRQQRLRRFKGPWMATIESRVKDIPLAEKWDQNALTPGTPFMARLADVLAVRCRRKRGVPVILSSAAEPGEGEHKLMTHLRRVRPKTVTIYGLDADLILLAMLLGAETGASVRLLREAQEFERGGRDNEWRTLHVTELAEVLLGTPEHIKDYVAAMSLLGNDFLPRSLTRTVRDEGIPRLIADLERVWAAGGQIVDGGLSAEGLLALLEPWAEHEQEDLRLAVVTGEREARRAREEWESLPARWASVTRMDYASWHPGSAAAYVAGLAWVWDYYCGRPVDLGWSFDEHLPPLWSDIVATLKANGAVKPPPLCYTDYLPAATHLFAVLPAASMARLLPSHLGLIDRMPWYWPTDWSLFDIGRTQLWECEPVIPVIPDAVLRKVDLT
jgi:5'-3' exonuclease